MEIQKNVPVPNRKESISKKAIIENMELGDCIFIAGAKDQKHKDVEYCRKTIRRLGFTPVTRKFEDGVRVWKMSDPK